jgi:hypothetical protein
MRVRALKNGKSPEVWARLEGNRQNAVDSREPDDRSMRTELMCGKHLIPETARRALKPAVSAGQHRAVRSPGLTGHQSAGLATSLCDLYGFQDASHTPFRRATVVNAAKSIAMKSSSIRTAEIIEVPQGLRVDSNRLMPWRDNPPVVG